MPQITPPTFNNVTEAVKFANKPLIPRSTGFTLTPSDTSATSPARETFVNSVASNGPSAAAPPIPATQPPAPVPEPPVKSPADTAFEAYLTSLQPSSRLTQATQRLGEFDTQAALDREKALETGETLGFATGEAGRVARQNAILRAGQAGTVSALTDLENRRTQIGEARYRFEKEKIDAANKTQPGFELSPGQSRFDAAGNVIASLPSTPRAISSTTDTGDTPIKPLDLQRVEDLYGFTPPLGVTMNQITKYVQDNPNRSPQELQDGVNQIFGTTPDQDAGEQFLDEAYFKQLSTKELKTLSDKAGTSKLLTHKTADINRFLKELMSKIEQERANGFTDKEIEDFLISEGIITEPK
jgi:hypothetical protein